MNSWIIPCVAGCLPLLALIASVHFAYKRRKERFKTPFTGKLLRPPGETLREKLLELDEKFTEEIIGFLFLCAGIGIVIYNLKLLGWLSLGIVVLIGYGACAFYALRIFRLGKLRRDYNLGFLGERAVGEELNRLMAKGYEVFHDVQFEGRPGSKNFNIDHVVVGPCGVFSIETKTRRKQVRKGYNSPRNIVEFDGSSLIYPSGSEDFGVLQARENALHLTKWLQQATADDCSVVPILALPGWSVNRKGRSDVLVVSGREVCSAFPKAGSKALLTSEQVQRITFQLEQRCRTVEVE